MNKSRCKTCEYYDPFFNGCNLNIKEVYLGEGYFDVYPVSIKCVSKSECEYDEKQNET